MSVSTHGPRPSTEKAYIVRGPIDQLRLEAWRKHRGVCPVSGYEGDRADMRR